MIKRFIISIIIVASMLSLSEGNAMEFAELVKNGPWAISEGTHNNLPLMIRFRNNLSRQADISKHPQLIQIYWDLEKSPSGMPSPIESEQMELFENRLEKALEKDLAGALVGVVTTNGYREWVYYVKSVEEFSERLHYMPQEKEPYPIEIQTEKDQSWDYFFNNIYTGKKNLTLIRPPVVKSKKVR